ncbi:hypothetical protein TVAG_083360 [Trichomonas vaginalis G3]|uniref:Uncharacterized protein n=1 Tax=Trichomonas vaginalis (strain ATCC PRA-98 / G3) TaxID=412133 RepID=A2DM63_TRIV3|nr:hypothetical protein TVAGG3_0983980 [Trichomonas vaginalis G3]EAY18483.1 hypothetical protein TVAG_083360 [Trichomonas vaginalis G3]KAI5489528.1 hypothetical protein TVAGG3_0983980 [Trichomonas vaginalis G3]|eukprot:XP_001579469.1 hypothetical protein [Trichomonas vaginalis G3]
MNQRAKTELRSSWEEYFGTETKVEQTQNGTAINDTTNSNNYYVFYCLFEECKEIGAIYIKRTNSICTLLENSKFNNCSYTSDDGGGSVLYHCYYHGQFVQKRTCYFKSIASNNFMAFRQWTNPEPSYKNYAIDVSVCNCGESESKGSFTFLIIYGDIIISNINSTNNKCKQFSSISSHLNGRSFSCNFSTFRGNNQTETYSLFFEINAGSPRSIQTISYCNVIGNKCGTDNNQVLFVSTYTTNVDHCIFLNNTAKYMFHNDVKNYKLTISDSYVDSQSVTSTGGSVTFTNLTNNYDFYNFYNFYTENCFAARKSKFSGGTKALYKPLFLNRRR